MVYQTMKRQLISVFLLMLGMHTCALAQTVQEKKAGLSHPYIGIGDLSPEMRTKLEQVNNELEMMDKELQQLYAEAQALYKKASVAINYREVLSKINEIKEKRIRLLTEWRDLAAKEQVEGYALWHQPNTTLEQLIIDYGAQDYIYLIPPEVGLIPISVDSNLPIPRAAWNDMLEIILTQNGVGVRQLNPYLRELFLLNQDRSSLRLITNHRLDLDVLPTTEYVAFMLTPEPSDVRRVWFFLEKFVNPNNVVLQQVGRDILIVAQVSEIRELLKVYDFIQANRGEKEYRVVPLNRVDADEMTQILRTVFGVLEEAPQATSDTSLRQLGRPQTKGAPPEPPRSSGGSSGGDNGIQVIPLTQIASAVFLIGTREEIRKAEQIIFEVEAQVGEAQGKIAYWYTTKHANAEELADVLYRIYLLMASNPEAMGNYQAGDQPSVAENSSAVKANINVDASPDIPPMPLLPPLRRPYEQGFFFDNSYVVNRPLPPLPPMANVDRDNFIVDLKTGSIVMVVEAYVLPRLKELIKKLDVPRKMVQLEILLFEKRIRNETDFGLASLKVGSKASHTNSTGATFNIPAIPRGIFDFFISRSTGSILPAFDAIYRFLLTQENIHINSCPSVLAINQTPAVIEIDEEISINTGIFAVDTVGGVTLENAFARARYGIQIEIVPTIYTQDNEFAPCWDRPEDYVTLATDITFQTINPSVNAQQPDVTTRHVLNEVSIPDGESVILGGLRQRTSRDAVERIPFFGEFPGVGKLFSDTHISDDTVEMFIIITPTIIRDPSEDLERVRTYELTRRPGDVPSYLCSLLAAEEWEEQQLFEQTLTMILGRKPDCCVSPPREYDGR